jgi:hypothetical protein
MSSIDERLAAEASAYQYFTSKEYQKQLMLCFPGVEKHFGHLPSAAGQTLLLIMGETSVNIQPLALRYDLREVINRANKPADARVKVDINIYGLRSEALDIGKRLSNGKLWLQRSSHGRHGFAYENPHFLNISIQDTGAGEVQDTQPALSDGVPKKMSKEDQLRKMVDEVYKTVENTRELEMVEGGDKVTRQLLRWPIETKRPVDCGANNNIDIRRKHWVSCSRESLGISTKSTDFGKRSNMRMENSNTDTESPRDVRIYGQKRGAAVFLLTTWGWESRFPSSL